MSPVLAMDPLDVFNYDNPNMSLIWKAASGSFKQPNRKDILEVDINQICDHLRTVIGNPNMKVNTRTYFKSSIVISGTLRINVMQADFLLADVKRLLATMRRERKIMKVFDKNLDCSTRGKKQIQLEQLDLVSDAEINLTGSPRTRMVTTIDFSSLDGSINWEQGPARAHPQDITLPDQDVAPSPRFMEEMLRLHALEENLEGPTFLDWEEIQMEVSPKNGEEKAVETKADPPIDILVPEEPQASIVPRIETEEAPLEEPPIVKAAIEEPITPGVPQAIPEPPVQEEPSQIELRALEENDQGRQRIKRKDSKLIIDKERTFSTEYMRKNISNYDDTMRVETPNEDVIDINKSLKEDFFSPKPPHRKNMTDNLVRYFRPCNDEAHLPGPTSSSHAGIEDIERGASYVEERDVSSIPSFVQDISAENSRSKSTIQEAPSPIMEEAPFNLQTIEEQEGVVSSPALITKEPESTKRKQVDRKDGKKSDGSSSSSPSRKSLKLTVEEVGGEHKIDTLETLPIEESEVSDSSEEGFTKVDEMTLMILDYFSHHTEAFFDDLLPENAKDRHLSRLFVILLHLCKDFKFNLHQEEVFGPIKITPCTLE